MSTPLEAELAAFAAEKGFSGKGPLAVALIVTDHARRRGLPLNAEELLTEGGGQVLGLGRGAVQSLLSRHGVDRVLAAEGGRTSRGSIGNMRQYVALLNALHARGLADPDAAEKFWVQRVREFFAGKPFRLRLDSSRGLRAAVRDLVAQAEERQRAARGTQYTGALLQHLVGAKLECVLGPGAVAHHAFSTSDAQGGRAGDFLVGDVAIHVTTSPGEAVIGRCRENLDDGLRPVLVTLQRGLPVAEGLAGNQGLAERVDVFEAEQFVALGFYERGRFAAAGRQGAVAELVERYNRIVEAVETDPSLRIEFRR